MNDNVERAPVQDKKGFQRRLPIGILVGLATVVVASGGGAAWFTWRSLNPPKPPVAEFPNLENEASELPPPDTSVSSPAVPDKPVAPVQEAPKQPDNTTAPAVETVGQIYWLKDDGTSLNLAPEEVALPAEGTADDQVKAAFDALLSKTGDPNQDAFTTIPEGTQVLDVSVEADGVHVNLSSDFQYGGGSASMMGRLGQVIYTATTLDPNAGVWLSVDGKPLTLLGGEGLEVTQPMTREEFKQAFGF